MSKKKSPLEIFLESIGLYFSNFDKFVRYMTFPVLGQVLGISLVFALTYFFIKHFSMLTQKVPALNEPSNFLIVLLALIMPGMIIFLRAFWEYLVAYGAINSMLENMLKSGKVYDFDAHTELVERRRIPFVGLWALFAIFSLIALIPFFWVPCAVLAIYFVLVFQVFTYEPDLSPIGCVKRSLELIKGHFLSTFMLLALVGALTYVLIPQLINLFCDYTRITMLFTNIVTPVVSELPINDFNKFLSYLYMQPIKLNDVALFVVTTSIAQIFIQYTLPLRSILWAMWYKELNGGKLGFVSQDSKNKKRKNIKRPSEKLMEESHKKFTSKKLDRNLLKRAMEKDED